MKRIETRRLALVLSAALVTVTITATAASKPARCATEYNSTPNGTIYTCDANGFKMQKLCAVYCCTGNSVVQYDSCQGSFTQVMQNNQPVRCTQSQIDMGGDFTNSISCN